MGFGDVFQTEALRDQRVDCALGDKLEQLAQVGAVPLGMGLARCPTSPGPRARPRSAAPDRRRPPRRDEHALAPLDLRVAVQQLVGRHPAKHQGRHLRRIHPGR